MKITSNSTNSNLTLLNSAPAKSFLDIKIFLLGFALLTGLITYLYFSYRPSNQLQKKKIRTQTGKQTTNSTTNPSNHPNSSPFGNKTIDRNNILPSLKKNPTPHPHKTSKTTSNNTLLTPSKDPSWNP
jgi:hypothetical protein